MMLMTTAVLPLRFTFPAVLVLLVATPVLACYAPGDQATNTIEHESECESQLTGSSCPARIVNQRSDGGEAAGPKQSDNSGDTEDSKGSIRMIMPDLKYCLGFGAYGSVWGSRDERLGAVAVKSIPFVRIAHCEAWSEIINEVKLLKKLCGHPAASFYFPHLYKVSYDNDQVYMSMEYLSGGNLQQLIAAGGPLEYDLVRHFSAQLLMGLKYLRDYRIVHCDINPKNIAFTSRWSAKIIDFGMAVSEQSFQLAAEGRVLRFWAPESRWRRVTCAADIWSWACVVFNMATATSLFTCDDFDSEWMCPLLCSLPERLAEVIRCGVRRNPAKRPAPAKMMKMKFFAGLDFSVALNIPSNLASDCQERIKAREKGASEEDRRLYENKIRESSRSVDDRLLQVCAKYLQLRINLINQK